MLNKPHVEKVSDSKRENIFFNAVNLVRSQKPRKIKPGLILGNSILDPE